MAINFASARPGIDLFNANVARGDERRSREEQDFERRAHREQQDFERRAQMEQQMGADKAKRNAIAAYYAQTRQAPVAPVPTTAFQPTPAQVPSPAATTVAPPPIGNQIVTDADAQQSFPVQGNQSIDRRQPRVADFLHIPAPGPIGAALNAGTPLPSAGAPPSAAPVMPATAATPSSTVAPGARAAGGFETIMNELAKRPGTGDAMMSLFSTDLTSQRSAAVENRKMQAEANKEIIAHLRNGDVEMAHYVAKQAGVKIPDEIWKNKGALMKMRVGANLAKTLGVKDDQAVHFMDLYMKGISSGIEEGQAGAQAFAAMPKDSFEVKGVVTDENNQVQAYDKSGKVKQLGVKARPQKWQVTGGGSGERATATVQNRDDMAKRLKVAYPGLDDSIVQRMVVNPRAQVTAQDIMRTAANMRKLTNMGRPVYKTDAEAHAAAVQAVRAAQKDAGVLIGGDPAAGAPPPAGPASAGPASTGPAGTVQPPKRMRFDAQGNEIVQ